MVSIRESADVESRSFGFDLDWPVAIAYDRRAAVRRKGSAVRASKEEEEERFISGEVVCYVGCDTS